MIIFVSFEKDSVETYRTRQHFCLSNLLICYISCCIAPYITKIVVGLQCGVFDQDISHLEGAVGATFK